MHKNTSSPVASDTPGRYCTKYASDARGRYCNHNEYIYKEVLGFADKEYEELVSEGHIGMEYDESVP